MSYVKQIILWIVNTFTTVYYIHIYIYIYILQGSKKESMQYINHTNSIQVFVLHQTTHPVTLLSYELIKFLLI